MERFKTILSLGQGCVACSGTEEKFYLLYHVPGAALAGNKKEKRSSGEQQKSVVSEHRLCGAPHCSIFTLYDFPATAQER